MNYFLGIDSATNRLAADFEEAPAGSGASGLNHSIIGTTAVTSNVWHHVAVTYDGTWKLYLDGNPDGTLVVNEPPRNDSIQHSGIGSAMNSTGVAAGFFAGVIDEIRIWNVARTQNQLQANKTAELTSGTGLVGRWGMNEASGTAVGNSVAGGVNGTALPPADPPTWVVGFDPPPNNVPVAVANSFNTPQDTQLVQAAPGVLANDTDADSNPLTAVLNADVAHGTLALNANGGFTYTPTAGYSGPDSFTYHANDGIDDSNVVTVSLTVYAPPAPLRGLWQFENNVADSSTYANNGTAIGSPGFATGSAGQAISFNGSSQYVTVTDNNSLDLTTGMTLAAWIRPTGSASRHRTLSRSNDHGHTAENGYGLSLSTAGKVFVRLNQATSADPSGSTRSRTTHLTTRPGCTLRPRTTARRSGCTSTVSRRVATLPARPRSRPTRCHSSLVLSSGTRQVLSGLLDDARVYATALSASEIAALAGLDTTPPAAPAGLIATAGNGTVESHLDGQRRTDLAGYNVYRSTTTPVALTHAAQRRNTVTTPTFLDGTAANGHDLLLRGHGGRRSDNESSPSNEVNATPTAPPELATALDLGSSRRVCRLWRSREARSRAHSASRPGSSGPGMACPAPPGRAESRTFIPLVTHGGPQADGSNVDANWLLVSMTRATSSPPTSRTSASGLNHPVSGTTAITTTSGTTPPRPTTARPGACTSTVASTRPRSRTRPRAPTRIQHVGFGVDARIRRAALRTDPPRASRASSTRLACGPARRSLSPDPGGRPPAAHAIDRPCRPLGDGRWRRHDRGRLGRPGGRRHIVGAGTSWPAGAPFDIPTVDRRPRAGCHAARNALLDGIALDDGQPSPLTTTWTQSPALTPAVINDPSSTTTSVSFVGSGTGDYVFRLTAFDGLTRSSTMSPISVLDPGPGAELRPRLRRHRRPRDLRHIRALGLPSSRSRRGSGATVPATSTSTGHRRAWSPIPLVTKGRGEADDDERRHELLPRHRRSHRACSSPTSRKGPTGTDPGLEPPDQRHDRHPDRRLVPRRGDLRRHDLAALPRMACSTGPLAVGQPVARRTASSTPALGTALISTGTPTAPSTASSTRRASGTCAGRSRRSRPR